MKAFHFYYLCCKFSDRIFEVFYDFECFVVDRYPEFDKKGPYDNINSFYQWISASMDAADYNKEQARIALRAVVDEIMKYEKKDRCRCFECEPSCFSVSNHEFLDSYFSIIDIIDPTGSFEDYMQDFQREINAIRKCSFKVEKPKDIDM